MSMRLQLGLPANPGSGQLYTNVSPDMLNLPQCSPLSGALLCPPAALYSPLHCTLHEGRGFYLSRSLLYPQDLECVWHLVDSQ